ncbi:MAG: hypothetical protein BWY17_04845 [Deltaproteobacteria bacterium ADurb.Bin207]|nr:MAG: hypothetical protein BWY17_04845 [Deltaproteobacteria bacterium ADurb.Bin207]
MDGVEHASESGFMKGLPLSPRHWPSAMKSSVIYRFHPVIHRILPSACLLLSALSWADPALPITRCEVLRRAQAWVDDPNAWYSWDPVYTDPTTGVSGYRPDCSGMVSAVWGLPPPGNTTYSFAPGPWDNGVSHVIGASELKPGDALNYPGNPSAGTGHIMLYVSGDFQGGYVEVMEEYNYGHTAERRWRSIDPSIYYPIRYNNIEDGEEEMCHGCNGLIENWGVCNQTPWGALDYAEGDSIYGWAFDGDAGESAIDVHVYCNGPVGSAEAVGVAITADIYRQDLCSVVGSCDHGFRMLTPLSLCDGADHEVHAYAIDVPGGHNPPLSHSPRTLRCEGQLPSGVARWIANPNVYDAWKFSGFHDHLPIDETIVDAVVRGENIPEKPLLVLGPEKDKVYLIDGDMKRHVPDPGVMSAWRFDWNAIQNVDDEQLAGWKEGPSVRERPVVVRDSQGRLLLIDDEIGEPSPKTGGSGGGPDAGVGGGNNSHDGGKEAAAGGAGIGDDNDPKTWWENDTDSGSCAMRPSARNHLEYLIILWLGAWVGWRGKRSSGRDARR